MEVGTANARRSRQNPIVILLIKYIINAPRSIPTYYDQLILSSQHISQTGLIMAPNGTHLRHALIILENTNGKSENETSSFTIKLI